MTEWITYGQGGYLPDLPGSNIVERLVDNDDGTATLTTYDHLGQPTAESVVPAPPHQADDATAGAEVAAEAIDRAVAALPHDDPVAAALSALATALRSLPNPE